LLCAAALAAPAPAWALFGDKLEIWAAENYTHDTNVLRLSDKLSDESLGLSQRGDDIWSTHVGISGNAQWSQQKVNGEYTRYRSKYRHFKELDFTGYTGRAHWDWVVNPGVTGTLGYTTGKGLSNFNNIQLPRKDIVTSEQAYATAAWLMTPRWRLNGGFTAAKTEHTDLARALNNIELASAEAGLWYITPLDNSFGGVVRYERGRVPNLPVSAFGTVISNDYEQIGVGAQAVWILTGHSRFDGRVDYVRRTYDQASGRNYRGPMAKLLYTWTPTAKITVVGSLSRDVGPAEDVNTSFVLVTGGYVRPRWNITEKVTLQGNLEYNQWDYQGDPPFGRDFTHKVSLIGAGITYRPFPKVLLSAGINREHRTSTLEFGDYDVTVGFVEGRVGF
jgi:exopolysaccharide biosynthesis operon protein EpsL